MKFSLLLLLCLIAVFASACGNKAPAPKNDAPVAFTTVDLKGVAEKESLLSSLPQSGLRLGAGDAPVQLVEYVDAQCPFCADELLDKDFKRVVNDFIKSGKLNIRLVPLGALGKDSPAGAAAIIQASRENKAWQALYLLYANQGEEDTWINKNILGSIRKNVAVAQPTVQVQQKDEKMSLKLFEEAKKIGVSGTPSFWLSRDGNLVKEVGFGSISYKGFRDIIKTYGP